MATFTDKKQRSWQIDFDVYLAEKVKAAVDVDLLNLFADTTAAEVLGNPVTLVRVLTVLCEEQFKKVTPEDFGRSLAGDSLEGAGHALLESVADFFGSQKRATMKLMIARSQMMVDQISAVQNKALKDASLGQLFSATSSPADSASPSTATLVEE